METLLDRELCRLTLAMAAPLVLAALGELLMERAGVLNVGIEGMMAVGAASGFLATFKTGSALAGVGAGMLAGGVLALVLAWYSVTLQSSQLTVGLSLFVLGMGLSSLLYRMVIGVTMSTPTVPTLPVVGPGPFGRLRILGDVVVRQNALAYLALVLVPLLSLVLWRTPFGLRLRAVGENPRALDAVGIDVARLRYVATVLGGLLIGLAGADLPLTVTGTYSDGMVGGRGWIALMVVIFGRWSPGWALVGALLFAYTEALQFKLALSTKAIPPQFLLMCPYLVAIVVLVRVYRDAQPPRALGRPYERERRA